MSRLRLLQDVDAAEKAWMAEATTVFGARDAGMAKFDGRATGEVGSRLRELHTLYMRAKDAYEAR